MPGFIARKLCPELIFVPVDFKKYTHYSDLTRKGQLILRCHVCIFNWLTFSDGIHLNSEVILVISVPEV